MACNVHQSETSRNLNRNTRHRENYKATWLTNIALRSPRRATAANPPHPCCTAASRRNPKRPRKIRVLTRLPTVHRVPYPQTSRPHPDEEACVEDDETCRKPPIRCLGHLLPFLAKSLGYDPAPEVRDVRHDPQTPDLGKGGAVFLFAVAPKRRESQPAK
jgi:hypothetical protein